MFHPVSGFLLQLAISLLALLLFLIGAFSIWQGLNAFIRECDMKQIYTGYQWRPMTEAELESWKQTHRARADRRCAGRDIYDGLINAFYCIGDRNASQALSENE